MELKKALDIAGGISVILAPHCSLINLAGSCRREKPEVKDIEIVALPFVVAGQDLFGGATEPQRPAAWTTAVNSLGTVVKGKPYGKYMQLELPEGIKLDLFMPDEYDYWRQFAIRTGSADWAARFIAGCWKKQGWCGSDQGLRMQSQCKGETGSDGKVHWKCVVPKAQQMLPPRWNSEQEFFDWLKIEFVHPKRREYTY